MTSGLVRPLVSAISFKLSRMADSRKRIQRHISRHFFMIHVVRDEEKHAYRATAAYPQDNSRKDLYVDKFAELIRFDIGSLIHSPAAE
jgi:hypothetical protein